MLNLYILFLLGSHVSATNQPPSLSGLQPSTPSGKLIFELLLASREAISQCSYYISLYTNRTLLSDIFVLEKEEESLEAFDRKVDGETVMKADPIPPRKINPGNKNLKRVDDN